MAEKPQYATLPRTPQVRFQNADGTTAKSLMAPVGSAGALVSAIWLASTDTTARVFYLFKNDGVFDAYIDGVAIPAATTGVPVQRVNLLDPTRLTKLDPNTIVWALQAGHFFKGQLDGALTSGKVVDVHIEYGDF